MWRVFLVIISFLMVFSAKAQVKMQKAEGGLLFREKGKNVLFYQIENKSQEGKFGRCNYIHPIWASDGSVLTEDFPADHLHHRGVFWAWHQVWIGDKQIGDPWEIKDFEQEITDLEFVSQASGVAILKTVVDWKSKQWKKHEKVVPYLREKATIKIHPKVDNYQKIDFEISLLALEENLRIGGSDDVKGYSGFSVRMVLPNDVSFTGPVGEIEPQNTAVESAGYVNISGSMLKGNKMGGIVMVDHPENPAYPQSWILRKRNSMQNAAFPGRETIAVSTKEPLVLKYSLLVYTGKLTDKKIQKIIP